MSEKITQTNVIELWGNQYDEVKRWLTKIQAKETSAFSLYRFCQWCGKEPPELLAEKDKDASVNPPPKIVEKLLDDFVVADIEGFVDTAKAHSINAVKSFFKYNYRDLAKASGAMNLEPVKEYNKLSKEGLRKLWNWTLNPRDRALITFVNSTAIAKETLTHLKWGHLEEHWETVDLPCINIPGELLKGHGRGKYKGVRQITFLTPEAKRDLLNYREWLEQKLGRKLTSEDNMWLETYAPYRPLSYDSFGLLVWELSNKTGVPFSWHDGRRWVNTALEQIAISPNWARKIRGRKVRGEEAPYSQPAINQLRAKFKEAVPLLEFTVERRAEIPKEVQDELAALKARQLAIELQYGRQYRKTVSVGKKPEKEEKEKDCEDGKHCESEEFKQISEAELLNHLRDGWRVIHNLQNGELIISKGEKNVAE